MTRLSSVDGPSTSLIGHVLARAYRIDEELGAGSIGRVYLGTQLAINRRVAIKVVQPSLLGPGRRAEETVRRFQQEAVATSRLRHPNTVSLFDFGSTGDGTLFLVLEHLVGRSLARVIAEEAPLAPIRVAHIGRQIAKSLSEAHSKEIVHRDVRPQNVFLCSFEAEDDFVKVMDFGIASMRRSVAPSPRKGFVAPLEQVKRQRDATRRTDPGIILGSPIYMSPEHAASVEATAASDVYSLGVLLYELLTGAPPFTADGTLGLALKHLHEPPPELEIAGASQDLVEEWSCLVFRLLAKSPDVRPSAAETAAELGRLRELARDEKVPLSAFRTQNVRMASFMADAVGGEVPMLRRRVEPQAEEPADTSQSTTGRAAWSKARWLAIGAVVLLLVGLALALAL